MMKRTLVYFTLLFILKIIENGKPPPTFRMTKVQCKVYDELLVRLNLCECRPIRRGVSVFNLNITHLESINDIVVNAALFKKNGWYKPFLINYTLDVCDYLKKRNHPLGNIVYDHFKKFSNLNHTCPFKDDIIIKDWYLRLDLLTRLPIPNGEYSMNTIWTFRGSKAHGVNVFFEFSDIIND